MLFKEKVKYIEEVVKIVQNEEKYLAESNFSANVTPFTKKIQPLLRRIIPKYMGFEIAGVQPVDSTSSVESELPSSGASDAPDSVDSDESTSPSLTEPSSTSEVSDESMLSDTSDSSDASHQKSKTNVSNS